MLTLSIVLKNIVILNLFNIKEPGPKKKKNRTKYLKKPSNIS